MILILLAIPGGYSQQYGFSTFSIEHGLPQSEVLALVQDSRGSIWIGTNGGGLSRFNGRTFETYTVDDGLPHNQINTLFIDSKGLLWIGAVNAFSKYDGYSFTNYSENISPNLINYNLIYENTDGSIGIISLDEQNAVRILNLSNDSIIVLNNSFTELQNQQVIAAVYLPDNILYINTPAGLYEVTGNEITWSKLNQFPEFGNRLIIPALYEKDSTLWIRAARNRNDILIYTVKDGKSAKFNGPETEWWQGVTNIFPDTHNRIWFGNNGQGLAVFERKTEQISYFRQADGFASDFITSFLEDTEGNVWFGTRGGGLMKYSERNFIAYNFKSVIGDDLVRAIYQDNYDNYWFSLAAGGVVRFDGNRFIAYSKDSYPGINNIRGFASLPGGKLLLVSFNGLFEYDHGKIRNVDNEFQLPAMNFSDALTDGDTLWLSSFNAGAVRIVHGYKEYFNLQNSLLQSNIVNNIYKDTRGSIWFSTFNGIAVYRNGEIERYTTEDGLNSSSIMQITQDHLGRYWIASYYGGLNIYDGNSFRYFTKSDGLTSNNIYSILTDPSGNIWAGTQNGVDQIFLDSTGRVIEIKNYGFFDGFTGIECNGQANFIDHENRLWFGTVNGAMRFDPGSPDRNLKPPVTHITGLKLFFDKVNWTEDMYSRYCSGVTPWFPLPQDLVFPYNINHLSFEFEAISFRVPEKVTCQWKLEGLDQDWSPVTIAREAVYPNIPPGSYTFKVRAMNNDGIRTDEPAEFHFIIRPPWWNTWWFYLLVILLIAATLTLIIRFRLSIIKARQQELEKIVSEKTSEATRQRDEIAQQNTLLEQQTEEILTQSERLLASYNNLEKLSEIGKAITSQLTVEHIIDTVYDSINHLMDATVFGIGIVNDKKKTIEFQGVKEKGATLDFLSFSLEDELRLSTYCVRNHAEVFINDFEEEFKKYLPEKTPAGASGNSSSIIYLPLVIENKVRGVITVQSFNKNVYTEYHLNILRNLAVYTKIALQNASSYHQIEEQSKYLKKANQNIRKQKQKIELTNRELIELNNEKNHLIGIVAHDLRNPLTSSLSVAEGLGDHADKLGPDGHESISFLVNALQRMDRMISKILNISLIEQKKISLNCEKINFGSIATEVYSNLKESASKKRIILHLETKDVFGIADRNFLIQVFENLLSNAIKFSPPGRNVWIRVEDYNHDARVNFIDEGPGLSADDMKKIFNKYQKLSARPTGGEPSTGLGLSIVRKYVDAMGGQVWCESRPGKGSDFIVSFRKASQ
jgi:signal transduction histidine kinase/ligand-binding sensor domain-containing protein